MAKIQIKKEILGVRYNNDCPCCGLNTNLLPESERTEKDSKKYCRRCYEEGVCKKQPDKSGFYKIIEENNKQDPGYGRACEIACESLRRLEIAHLYGEKFRDGDTYLDMFCDREKGSIYFRFSVKSVDDEEWFSTENYYYVTPEQVVKMLNENDIRILDGMTAENWKNYFEFID